MTALTRFRRDFGSRSVSSRAASLYRAGEAVALAHPLFDLAVMVQSNSWANT